MPFCTSQKTRITRDAVIQPVVVEWDDQSLKIILQCITIFSLQNVTGVLIFEYFVMLYGRYGKELCFVTEY